MINENEIEAGAQFKQNSTGFDIVVLDVNRSRKTAEVQVKTCIDSSRETMSFEKIKNDCD